MRAYCLERARVCLWREIRVAPDSVDRRDFSDLETRWLALARSYEFQENLANRIHDRDASKRYVGSILRRAGADCGDSISIACMTLAFVETMKAVSLTGDEKPDSATVARLIVDLAKQGELDHSGHRPGVAKVLDLTEDWTEQGGGHRSWVSDRGKRMSSVGARPTLTGLRPCSSASPIARDRDIDWKFLRRTGSGDSRLALGAFFRSVGYLSAASPIANR